MIRIKFVVSIYRIIIYYYHRVNVLTCTDGSVSLVSGVTFTSVTAVCVSTGSVHIAIVRRGTALVDIPTLYTVANVSVPAAALESFVGVQTVSVTIAVVRLHLALVHQDL